MARVIADIIEGEVRITADAVEARRAFLIQELSGAPAARLPNAALAPGVPRVGDAHPHLPGAVVESVQARAGNDPGHAFVDVTYRGAQADRERAGGWRVSIEPERVDEETTQDINGDLIQTTYTSVLTTTGLNEPDTTSTTVSRRNHRVSVQRVTFSLVFERDQQQFPFAVARRYNGVVNADSFQGEGADRWLARVSALQNDDGEFRVRWRFTLAPVSWQPRLTHFNAQRLIPDDVRAGNGIATAQIYPRRSFATLGLPRA